MQSRRMFLFALVSIVTISSLGLFSSVHAQTVTPMSGEQTERIRSNCTDAQASLSRLHASDALLRVNRGQLYESLLTKLMAPFNGRASANRLDSATLITITGDFERELNQFRVSYISYEESLSSILAMNCTSQPVVFYNAVNDSRAKREVVHVHTKNLEKMLISYQTTFETLAKTIEGAS